MTIQQNEISKKRSNKKREKCSYGIIRYIGRNKSLFENIDHGEEVK